MPNLATSAALVETATKCLATAAFSSTEAFEGPIAGGVGVGHRFQRGEGFGGDDEQGFGGIEVADGFGEIGAVDVGDEAERHAAIAVEA